MNVQTYRYLCSGEEVAATNLSAFILPQLTLGMASIDERYELVGVLNRKGDKYSLSDRNLDSYFIPKKETRITKEYLETIGRGIGYTKSPNSYLFMRTN